ncbi:unnamed protein product [Prorocentrum cordatum]|uniref:Uncharacterized protein n=1 Tax=Prorocentrum cordatum TaxID=2364126 RepID=A0ABN9WX83_9DINO|nr:unnamed protein product [Polarella glacialis]
MLHFHYAIFRKGQYTEVLAYSEDMHDDRVSDLYVRVPAIAADLYAIVPSDCSIERVWENELRFVRPTDMSRVLYHISSLHGFMMPVLQPRALNPIVEDYQVQHLHAVVSEELFERIFRFASYVRTHYYNEDHVDGGTITSPSGQQRATLLNICERLHGTLHGNPQCHPRYGG